ncbi:NUDIX hydrolase [Evansella tamaricis]|uniref:8-oxo-dGTP diphosphatase n=1 Tax=Evansella tamaricis TaxID=2069301 RepID=A0ABS6JF26_9BACI|nr:8-oxo-dGTP diphosphatase [Evansella tamaricis]MBU9712113.1 8-oxo-dGTP diphosphatase [Evansella tamaricis]
MQRVTNCILTDQDKVLTLKKPKRGWWVAPGGKMETGESIRETVIREFWEETGITLNDPDLKGVFTILIEENGEIVDEWMMFTFHSTDFKGELLKESPEGILAWHPKEMVKDLPMAAGDYHIWKHVLTGEGIMYGTFHYTKDFELLAYRFDVNGKHIKKSMLEK